jgi:hypothetical protein
VNILTYFQKLEVCWLWAWGTLPRWQFVIVDIHDEYKNNQQNGWTCFKSNGQMMKQTKEVEN